jgi:hypothetical protein
MIRILNYDRFLHDILHYADSDFLTYGSYDLMLLLSSMTLEIL